MSLSIMIGGWMVVALETVSTLAMFGCGSKQTKLELLVKSGQEGGPKSTAMSEELPK
jgi:hypothetical protein